MGSSKINPSKKRLRAARQVSALARDYYAKAREAKRRNRLIGWHLGIAPYELMRVLGVFPLMPENFASLLTAKGQTDLYLQQAEELGYARGGCSLHRVILGYALSGEELMIPAPDFLLASDNPCDGTSKVFLPIVEQFRIPYYYLDTPYHGSPVWPSVSEPEQLDYYLGQLHELIKMLEELTGQRLDEEQLRESLSLAARACTLWGEINELRKTVPCPMGAAEEVSAIYPLVQLLGTREAVGFYELLLREVEGVAKEGRGLAAIERHRLLWLGVMPYYDTQLFNYCDELGAVVVKTDMDVPLGTPFDSDDPLGGLARRMMLHAYNTFVEHRVAMARAMVRDYRIDGVVLYANRGCRIYNGGIRAVSDALRQEMSLPILLLEGEMVDGRGHNAEEVRERLQGFVETLG